jgi:hypothetical protein
VVNRAFANPQNARRNSMEAHVLLTLKIDEKESYKVDLNLPVKPPSKEAPFNFRVTHMEDNESADVMDVAIADKDNYYIRVAPPGSLFRKAGMGNVVEDLAIEVNDGNNHS